jgi:oxygen-independent coproporphyrinogen-3 oxidase
VEIQRAGNRPREVDNIDRVTPPTTRGDLGVYVHLPFCERICPYCDFAVEGVGALPRSLEEEYVGLLVQELDLARAELPDLLEERALATVYLGGGTPSLLSPRGVEAILSAVRGRFPGEPDEVTLELNPGTTESARVPGFRDAGVTRLSIGVQSLRDDTLKRLGRAHKGAEALRALEACLAAGLRSLSVDLIYGAPGQTEEGLLADLSQVLDLGVPHVSAYALTVEPGTPFARGQKAGRLALPDEETLVRMGRRLRAELNAAGRRQYEISNFALPGHRSRHNQRYWRGQDVLGVGVSAASLLGPHRIRNPRHRDRWTAEIRRGHVPWEEREERAGIDARRDALFIGLRMIEGISRAEYLRRYGARPEDDFGAEIRELTELGLLESAGGFLRPTERGILFSNEVLLRFVGR